MKYRTLALILAGLLCPLIAAWALFAPAERIRIVRAPADLSTSQQLLQAEIDELADGQGGTIQLDAGATYVVDAIRLPWTADLRYRSIKLHGSQTRIVSLTTSTAPVVWVGDGWNSWDGPWLTGIEFRGISFEQRGQAPGTEHSNRKALRLEATDGTRLTDCRFNGPLEGLYVGSENRNLMVESCTTFSCGKGWPLGPLGGYNPNGRYTTLKNCVAVDCGWGLESASTGLRVINCSFVDAPCVIGNAVHGVSDVELAGNYHVRSQVEVVNGIGRVGDIRVLSSTFIDSPFCWSGGAASNGATAPGLAFSDRPSVVEGNSFNGTAASWQGQAIRIVQPYQQCGHGSLHLIGNSFDCAQQPAVIVQGTLPEATEIRFRGNWCKAPVVGQVHSPAMLDRVTFARNRFASNAVLTVDGELPRGVQ